MNNITVFSPRRRIRHGAIAPVTADIRRAAPVLNSLFRRRRIQEETMSSTIRTGTGSGMQGGVATNETAQLIAASKVNGTNVYNRQGESLGSIYDVMIDKRSGHVQYAIMSFGGFLGMGEHYHPLPWHLLQYDEGQGGYIVDLTRDRLQGAPAYATSATPDWSTGAYGRQVDDYYGVSPATARTGSGSTLTDGLSPSAQRTAPIGG
jgi:sporulation protein YlmC with PRC-barrel domain